MSDEVDVSYLEPRRIVGGYAVFHPIGSGGMGTVHLARRPGSPVVAIKCVHTRRSEEPAFATMLVDEARMSASVDHPNVIRTIDVVDEDDEVLLVMEYVAGESLYRLLVDAVSREEQVPVPVAVRIASDVLRGLQAAHDATDEDGTPLNIIHRDVSPQNVLVGLDGASRLFDFGVAKARGRQQSTRDGSLKGKLGYMAPEQLQGRPSPQSDIFAASTVLWEVLTGRRLFDADNEGATIFQLLHGALEPPSAIRTELPPGLDQAVMRGLSRSVDERFAKASDMADALAGAAETATRAQVSRWVQEHARERLEARAKQVRAVENAPLSVSGETSAPSRADMPDEPTTGSRGGTCFGVADPSASEPSRRMAHRPSRCRGWDCSVVDQLVAPDRGRLSHHQRFSPSTPRFSCQHGRRRRGRCSTFERCYGPHR